jgi:hypothetical protein
MLTSRGFVKEMRNTYQHPVGRVVMQWHIDTGQVNQ